jgi:pyrimidine-nucleoside phosphorylase
MDGKKIIPDLLEVNNLLAGAMIYLGGKSSSIDEGVKIAGEKINDGSAFKKFLEIVECQEGDTNYIRDYKNFKRSKLNKKIYASKDGYIKDMIAYYFGMASIELGCGRKKVDDKINYLAGIELFKKCGETVKKGEPICELWAENEKRIYNAEVIIERGLTISDSVTEKGELIYDILYS